MGALAKFVSISKPTEQEIVELWNIIKPSNLSLVGVADMFGLRGTGDFPFSTLVVDPDPSGKKQLLDKEWVYESTVMEGRGLAFSSSLNPNLPLWSCRYNVLLSLALFNDVRPPENWAPPLRPTPLKYGSRDMRLGLAGEDMLPIFARKVINERIGNVIGSKLDLKFETVEFPEHDHFVRIKIDLGDKIR